MGPVPTECLTENAKVMQAQQAELVRQGDLMLQAIAAAGEVSTIQNALNENLAVTNHVRTI